MVELQQQCYRWFLISFSWFLIMRKRPPVCVNLYNQGSCSLQPCTFLSGTVPSRGVGRKDFFWLSTPAFLPFPHLRLHGPRSIQSPEVVPSQFRLQQEDLSTPHPGVPLHTHSRVTIPKTQTWAWHYSAPEPTAFSRTLRMALRCSSRALKVLPTLDSVYLCSFKSLRSLPGTIPLLSRLCHHHPPIHLGLMRFFSLLHSLSTLWL